LTDLAITSGSSCYYLADEVYELLESFMPYFIQASIINFANKEIFTSYDSPVSDKDLYIFQTFNSDPNKDLVELLLLIHTAKLSSPKRITAVLPIIYGSRQDRKSKLRSPITIKLVADLLKTAGADRIITFSLHNPASVSAFDIPIYNLSTASIFLPTLNELNKKFNFIVVSPDVGGLGKARYYAKMLNTDIAFADKRRPSINETEIIKFVGDIKGKNCLIIDDMIDTGKSLKNVVLELKKQGAKLIYVLATHLILSDNAVELINELPIEKVFGTNSINYTYSPDKFEIFSVGKLLANVISNLNLGFEPQELAESIIS